MWKIHRYYLKETGVNALLTFTVLFGIALISLSGIAVARAMAMRNMPRRVPRI